mmetsp:Transcript_33557/g.40546  ORF Transcript_33557/g.40546 Transcript_33557/m.40546 type:complete len:967 (+) Transcript_33557:117-3017(+)|eukprot:CAMPEP_0197852744 /NCGR_PEP_ID=MMETSP1438-20131217/21290_1 /TAXON_ID=1461541 /ORGANISM="Pterosperma sp., Strain CCMP1384" /LENGTH=966 /DNA_ID=CAMNT_0043466905 /DNA_START=105 /DNA_END=3005 /DNA_ORIENTATION=+
MDKDVENRAESGSQTSCSDAAEVLKAATKPEEPLPPRKKVKRRKRKPYPISLNLSNCKYEVIRMVQKKLGWKEVGDEDDWQVYWTDTSVSIERIMRLKKTQKINHFTGMLEICRKKSLAKNLTKMSKLFPDDFKFVPKSFNLPVELPEFLAQFQSKKKKTFILKPDSGCQGKGICLAQNAEAALKALGEHSGENVVAQRYLAKPYLIDGMKFDLRVYVLVVSCDPLRVFIYEEGLARFCTEKYCPPTEDNLEQVCMHLTNYALNKHNDKFLFNDDAEKDDCGSKWSITGLREYLAANSEDFETAWTRIQDLTVKTLISIQPILTHNYRSVLPQENDGFSCFELLGLDVMLDHKLKPWLIEVNHSPSFTVDTPLDLAIKEELISDTIELVGVDPKLIKKQKEAEREDARNRLYGGAPGVKEKPQMTDEEHAKFREQVLKMREKYEAKHMGGFTMIYPSPDPVKNDYFNTLLEGSAKSFRESIPHKVRDTLQKVKEERERRLEAEANKEKVGTMGRPPKSEKEKELIKDPSTSDPKEEPGARKRESMWPGTNSRREKLQSTSATESSSMAFAQQDKSMIAAETRPNPRRLVGIPRAARQNEERGVRPGRLPSGRLLNLVKAAGDNPWPDQGRHSHGTPLDGAQRRMSLEDCRNEHRGELSAHGRSASISGRTGRGHAAPGEMGYNIDIDYSSSGLGNMAQPPLPDHPKSIHSELADLALHAQHPIGGMADLGAMGKDICAGLTAVPVNELRNRGEIMRENVPGLLSTSGLGGDGRGRVDIRGDLRELLGVAGTPPKSGGATGSGSWDRKPSHQHGSTRPRSVDSQTRLVHANHHSNWSTSGGLIPTKPGTNMTGPGGAGLQAARVLGTGEGEHGLLPLSGLQPQARVSYDNIDPRQHHPPRPVLTDRLSANTQRSMDRNMEPQRGNMDRLAVCGRPISDHDSNLLGSSKYNQFNQKHAPRLQDRIAIS